MEKILNLKVDGMYCEHCAKKVETALKYIKGVKNVDINLETGLVNISLKKDIELLVFVNLIENLGYECKLA